MAITSAELTASADSVGLNSATITYKASGSLPKDTNTYEYHSPNYVWSFTPGGSASGTSGTKTITGLTAGTAKKITATLTLYCQRDVYYKDEEGNWKYDYTDDNYKVDSETDLEITVYTRPGVFSGFDGNKDQLINEVINSTSATNWNTHCSKYMSWKNQKATTVNIAFPSG